MDTRDCNDLRARGMMHVNKVHHVTTITQVAKDLGEDEIKYADRWTKVKTA